MAPLDFTVPGLYQRNRQKDRVSGTHGSRGKRVDASACRKKGSESLVLSPLVPFATCKLD